MRAVIYTRVSTGKQEEDGTSLGTQEERCRAYAADRGWQVTGMFTDTSSGAQYRERAGLTALRESVRAGSIGIVLCYALDRLSRNQAHVYILAEEIEQHGARLALVTEEFEDSAVGRFIRSAKAFAAEVEREKTSERTMRGKQARVASGRPLPGPRPLYGYRWVDDSKSALVHDPITSIVVRRMFTMVLSGTSVCSIARTFMAEGIPTPTGKTIWRPTTIRHILTHPGYKGVGYGWAWRGMNGKKHRVIDTENAIMLPAGTYPPMVTEQEWDAVVERLERNRADAKRNNHDPEATLLRAGFVHCGHCGRSMRVRHGTHGPAYACDGAQRVRGTCDGFPRIQAKMLDVAVWEKVRTVLEDPDRIACEVNRMQGDDPTSADIAAIDRAIRAAERERENFIEAIASMQQTDAIAVMAARVEAIGQRLVSLTAEREAVLTRQRAWQLAQQRLDDLRRWCQSVATNLDRMTYAERRDALLALGVATRVHGAKHQPRYEIHMNIPLTDDVVNRSSR